MCADSCASGQHASSVVKTLSTAALVIVAAATAAAA
jgi:hypothetical protein